MAKEKPIVSVTAPASRENIGQQIKNSVDYAESILSDIAKATKDNEVVQARLGHDTLSQTLQHYYNHLPVVMYEGQTGSADGKYIQFNKLIMYWRGKQYVRRNVKYEKVSGDAYNYFAFDISTNDFVLKRGADFPSNRIPIFKIKGGYKIYPLIAFFDENFNVVNHVNRKIENKNCFAWVCSPQTEKTWLSTFLIHEINNSTIDMRGIKSRFWKWQNNNPNEDNIPIIINNSKILNAKGLSAKFRFDHTGAGNTSLAARQFNFTGTNNLFHLLDNTEIDSNTWGGNAIEIPYDTEEQYYQKVKQGNQGVSIKRNKREMIVLTSASIDYLNRLSIKFPPHDPHSNTYILQSLSNAIPGKYPYIASSSINYKISYNVAIGLQYQGGSYGSMVFNRNENLILKFGEKNIVWGEAHKQDEYLTGVYANTFKIGYYLEEVNNPTLENTSSNVYRYFQIKVKLHAERIKRRVDNNGWVNAFHRFISITFNNFTAERLSE